MNCYCIMELKECLKQIIARYPEYNCDLLILYENDTICFQTRLNQKGQDDQPELEMYANFYPGPNVSFAAMFMKAISTFDRMTKDQKAETETQRVLTKLKGITAEREAFMASQGEDLKP